MKKEDKKKWYKLLAITSMILIITIIFDNSFYIIRLINTIDRATHIVLIVDGEEVERFDFEEVIPEFAYGHIMDIKKPWNYIFKNNSKNYNGTNIEVHYLKDDNIVGKAKVFTNYNNNDEYIFFMKNVYYKGSRDFKDLLKLDW